jgi:hypothetical protein
MIPCMVGMRVVTGLVLAAVIVSPALGQPASTVIVPGHALGPVSVGMPATEAREAAAMFERKTGCGIDLLVEHGVVVAAGSPWAGCLHLQLPSDTPLMVVSDGLSFLPVVPVVVGISGPPVALVNAFGAALVVSQGADNAALIFPNGLVAHVSGMHAHGGIVSYLAVQATGSMSVPQIGHFTDEANVRRRTH